MHPNGFPCERCRRLCIDSTCIAMTPKKRGRKRKTLGPQAELCACAMYSPEFDGRLVCVIACIYVCMMCACVTC